MLPVVRRLGFGPFYVVFFGSDFFWSLFGFLSSVIRVVFFYFSSVWLRVVCGYFWTVIWVVWSSLADNLFRRFISVWLYFCVFSG